MAYEIFPKCSNDDIRKQQLDLTNPLNNRKIRPKIDDTVCPICSRQRVIIATGNRYDDIEAIKET